MKYWDWYDSKPVWTQRAINIAIYLAIILIGIWFFAEMGWGDHAG